MNSIVQNAQTVQRDSNRADFLRLFQAAYHPIFPHEENVKYWFDDACCIVLFQPSCHDISY